MRPVRRWCQCPAMCRSVSGSRGSGCSVLRSGVRGRARQPSAENECSVRDVLSTCLCTWPLCPFSVPLATHFPFGYIAGDRPVRPLIQTHGFGSKGGGLFESRAPTPSPPQTLQTPSFSNLRFWNCQRRPKFFSGLLGHFFFTWCVYMKSTKTNLTRTGIRPPGRTLEQQQPSRTHHEYHQEVVARGLIPNFPFISKDQYQMFPLLILAIPTKNLLNFSLPW